jgi:hypothetical protein
VARPAILLRELEGSPLFAPDFPRRPRFTHAEWAANPEAALQKSLAVGVAAVRRLDHAKLRDLVWKLGGAKFAPALPVLAVLARRRGIVGLDFIWDYDRDDDPPDFGLGVTLAEMDPLSIEPAKTAPEFFEEWRRGRSAIDPELNDPCKLYLAPDRLHKANTSGGEPYGVELPFLGADPVFADEEHALPFIDYLRLAFRWAAFPASSAMPTAPPCASSWRQ